LTILLREGLEALLVVVAMIAFLKKANALMCWSTCTPAGVIALACGGATRLAATYLAHVSGASRELTRGLSSLFAAAVLLGVGIVDAWQRAWQGAGRSICIRRCHRY
jgi:high-affinity iron transporter